MGRNWSQEPPQTAPRGLSEKLDRQDPALFSTALSQTTSVQPLATPLPRPVTPPVVPPIIEPVTPAQQVINFTSTTQAVAVPKTRSCTSTTVEMLFNSPCFLFFQSLQLAGVCNPLLVACIRSLQARKYATPRPEMNSSAYPMEMVFDQMRRMSQSDAIHQCVETERSFKSLLQIHSQPFHSKLARRSPPLAPLSQVPSYTAAVAGQVPNTMLVPYSNPRLVSPVQDVADIDRIEEGQSCLPS